ncbi:MAG: type II toxin-antitoxin system VapC family toxin [Myxococcales bacterium]|nr:type II toxin-antitoxin system VapC family toxin [Myxococcales bacterium]MCB9579532.1 type II toxin-antitoxin system VapC family toxin [Polyangiaceae bacterium]
MYVLDTDVISLVMRGSLPERARARLSALSRSQVRLTSVTLGELYYGALRTSQVRKWLDAVALVTSTMDCLDFDAEAARHYGELRAHLEAKGQRLDDADLRIASICRCNAQVLVSGNEKHFARVPGLRYENWIA